MKDDLIKGYWDDEDKPVGRPRQPPTVMIRVRVDKLKLVEKLLNRSLARNAKPSVNIRVPVSRVAEIRELIK